MQYSLELEGRPNISIKRHYLAYYTGKTPEFSNNIYYRDKYTYSLFHIRCIAKKIYKSSNLQNFRINIYPILKE